MGRPLYSKAYQTDPIIREPQPPCPYQKWSYINTFDPDSDEFFENDQAVYEAFIDRVTVEHSEDEEEMEEREDMVVIRLDISGEDGLSDRDSPMAVGADDPAQYIAQAYRRQRVEAETPIQVRLATHSTPREVQRDTSASPESVTPPPRPVRPTQSHGISHGAHLEPRDEIPLPSPSAPIPVPGTRSHRSSSVEGLSFSSFYHQNSPLTPPTHHTPFNHFSPSPPPTVSPRIYTWASRRQTYSATGTSPLTNTNARMSHAHISPALVRV
ncbi:uncharacterized protein EDB91DRAFT_1251069 [Suillus paluster]|uniref:uncharacterized protein n=1 Tax=Suillus paluster TaxID=48578 RepID=UPI001B861353|nr:uncharacterized protein EDB91DRAFT_1251069 [Suillus paluster]KAG1734030.1 hypothetical protein EDB91DRAFT_1251069 [Suillus paluster]